VKFLLVVILLAVAVYLTTRAIQNRGVAPRGRTRHPSAPPPRPLGPDDDDEFLRNLERKRRHPEDPENLP
jgi:hypothetical protein